MASDLPVIAEDDRQKDQPFKEALRDYFDVKIKHLSSGDFVWSCPLGSVGVEDKSLNDLTTSRTNGRLDDELRRLVDNFALPILFVRNTVLSPYARWTSRAVENLMFGRQLYGVYVYSAAGTPDGAARSLSALHQYTQTLQPRGMEGVRREPKLHYRGPTSMRAEVIYSILGLVTGIRGRRFVADQIASTTSVGEMLRWSVSDFTFAGFSVLMARKLVATIQHLEAIPSKS